MLSFDILIKESVVVKYANSNILIMEEIKTTFPFIYIKQIDFYFIFELTLCDLLVKHGKNFFLVVFNKNNPTNSFLLVSIGFAGFYFLKKYLFKKKIKSK